MIWIPFITYLIYNIILLVLFGAPENLSSSFYLYKKYKIQWIFPVTMILIASILMPMWLDVLDGSNFQFLAFFCPISIIFMAFAPDFKGDSFEYKIHSIGAIMAALFSLIAIIFILKCVWVLIFTTILILLISIMTRTLKSWVYWLETIAFLSTFISLLYIAE